MSEKSQKTQKKNWFKGLNAEFKKIIWPDKQTLVKRDGGSSFRIRSAGSNHRIS